MQLLDQKLPLLDQLVPKQLQEVQTDKTNYLSFQKNQLDLSYHPRLYLYYHFSTSQSLCYYIYLEKLKEESETAKEVICENNFSRCVRRLLDLNELIALYISIKMLYRQTFLIITHKLSSTLLLSTT